MRNVFNPLAADESDIRLLGEKGPIDRTSQILKFKHENYILFRVLKQYYNELIIYSYKYQLA